MENIVFVYGSLKKGFINNSRLKNAEFIGSAKTVEKYEMYRSSHGNWPYLIKDHGLGSLIKGEVYSLSDNLLKVIDEFEGHPDYYKRELVKVKLTESEEVIEAFIYFFTENDRPKWQIPAAEWFQS